VGKQRHHEGTAPGSDKNGYEDQSKEPDDICGRNISDAEKVGARKAISRDIGRRMRTIAKVPKSAVLKVLFAASISPFCRSMVKNLDTELLTELIRSVT
jgi:hypothetical protein